MTNGARAGSGGESSCGEVWGELPRFRSHPWVRGGHAQTILGSYWPAPPLPAVHESISIRTADGDRLHVHHDRPVGGHGTGRAALLLHGLGGCHRSRYVARLAARLATRGWDVYRMDMRGCGDGALTARGHTHAGRWTDLAEVIEGLEARDPSLPKLSLVGFSMGGNQLLKLLGCWSRTAERVERGIAIAPPLKLALCAEQLDRGLNRIYDWSFVRNLKRMVQRRRNVPGFLASDRWQLPDRLRRFDSQWTAPINGYRDVDDYYDRASAVHELGRIPVPTLIVAADDDPIVPAATFDGLPAARHVRVLLTDGGGHLGYVGADATQRHWLDHRLVEQLEAPLPESRSVDVPHGERTRTTSSASASLVAEGHAIDGLEAERHPFVGSRESLA